MHGQLHLKYYLFNFYIIVFKWIKKCNKRHKVRTNKVVHLKTKLSYFLFFFVFQETHDQRIPFKVYLRVLDSIVSFSFNKTFYVQETRQRGWCRRRQLPPLHLRQVPEPVRLPAHARPQAQAAQLQHLGLQRDAAQQCHGNAAQ